MLLVPSERAMMPTVPPIELVQTMIHEVPRGRAGNGAAEVVLSQSPTTLNDRTDRFIREEMLQPSFVKGREIIFGSDYGSPVPELVRAVLRDNSQLGVASQRMAEHLHKSQSASASAGVFLCALARTEGLNRIVIMKAEHQEGVRLRQSLAADGEVTFEVEHLDELILGRAAQVYKIALLWIDPSSDHLHGLMVDRQNGFGYADYFLSEYLGFELVHQAEVLTKDFVDAFSKYLRSPNLSPEKKVRYGGAVAAVLESPSANLNPSSFIRDFIDAEDRDEARSLIPAQVLGNEFRKDVTLVRSQIGGMRVSTGNGVTVQASSQAIEAGTIEIEPQRIVINGEPVSYNLSRAPK